MPSSSRHLFHRSMPMLVVMTTSGLIAAPATAQLFTETAIAIASPPAGPQNPGFNAVAIDGDIMVQGAQTADPGGQVEGAAYVFYRDAGGPDNWGQVKELVASDLSSANFGWAVEIVGDTIFVGAPLDPALQFYGAVYVFERDSGGPDNWGETKKIVSSQGTSARRFGRSIAAQGSRLVVGAESGPVTSAGSVYVYERDQGGPDNWGEVAYLTASDAAVSEQFGYSVDTSNDRIAVGANGDDSGRGAVYLFEYDTEAAAWIETQKKSGTNTGHALGTSVSLFHEWLLVGVPGADRANLYWIHAGGHYTWGLLRTFQGASNYSYGTLVDLEYPLAIVASTTGVVDVFRAAESSWPWTLVQTLSPSDGVFAPPVVQKTFDLDGGHFGATAGSVSSSPYGSAALVFDAPTLDLTVTKDDGADWTTPYTEITYQLTATNNGSDATVAATLRDDLDPAFLCCGTWTCAAEPGSGAGTGCPASGDSDELRAGVPINLESGDSIVLLATAMAFPSGALLPNTATLVPPSWLVDVDPDDNVATDTNGLRELDFGDAPLAYPRGDETNYALHGIEPGFHLGAEIDAETTSQPDAMALGDDNDGIDDEDGVVFSGPLGAGTSASVDVTASAPGLLNAWFDFNADGDWTDSNEHVFIDTPLAIGVNPLLVPVPLGATIGSTFARFRFDDAGGLSPEGAADIGEVEDHMLEIVEISADLSVVTEIPKPWAPDGQPFSYTLTVANAGPNTATGIALTDTLPAEVQFLGATAGCSHAAGIVSCALSDMSAASSAVIVIDVLVPGETAGPLTNTAEVTANEIDNFPGNNSETLVTPVFLFTDGFESGDLTGWSDDSEGP